MKKNIWYLLVLILLVVAVYFLVFKNKMTTLNGRDNDFAVADTASINKIFLADMSGKSVTLQRSNLHWIMNNTYPVRNDEIQVLLSTIKDVAVKYPVAEAAHNNVIKKLAANAIKVELYNKTNSLIKSYYVGGPDPLQTGTYMVMPGSDKPYATYIPGFDGYLTTRYSLDTDIWRDRTIFSFDIPQISSVIVNYTDNRKDSSFEIDVIHSDSFRIKPLNGKPLNKPVAKEKLFLYLLAYKFVNAEGYKNYEPTKDSLLHTIPFCTFTVIDKAGIPHVAKCFHKKVSIETMQQFDENGQPVSFDVDHYYASINDGKDFVLIQQYHFGRLFKTYDYFFTPIAAPLKR
jgi:hypothetical protein